LLTLSVFLSDTGHRSCPISTLPSNSLPSAFSTPSKPAPPFSPLSSSLSQQIHAALYPFGIFKTIDVRLETAQSILAPEGSVDVVVDVKEVPRWYLKSGTEVGAGEGGAYVTANVRNVFGGAETLGVQFSTGTKTRLAFEVGVCLFFLTATFWELKLISLHAENRSMLLSPSPSPPPSFPPHL
jgi:hypothetical protein